MHACTILWLTMHAGSLKVSLGQRSWGWNCGIVLIRLPQFYGFLEESINLPTFSGIQKTRECEFMAACMLLFSGIHPSLSLFYYGFLITCGYSLETRNKNSRMAQRMIERQLKVNRSIDSFSVASYDFLFSSFLWLPLFHEPQEGKLTIGDPWVAFG